MILAMIIDQGSDVISNKKLGFSLLKTFFFFFFFLRSRKFGQKKRPNFGGYLFFVGDHQYLATKTDSIRSNIDQSLGQDRLMLF